MDFREIAKFLSGLVVGDFLVGVWFYTSASLPLDFFGFHVTRGAVPYWMVVDAIIFILLIRYAWFSPKKHITST